MDAEDKLVPALQLVQELAETAEYLPATHEAQLVDPVLPAKVLVEQLEHAFDDAAPVLAR